MTQSTGWGAGEWGTAPWGGNTVGALDLVDAQATAENVIQLEFSRAIYITGLLDTFDASRPEFYSVAPVAGTKGYDGTDTRPVTVVSVAVVDAPGFVSGQIIALTLDRPMTPFPGEYTINCSSQIKSADLSVSIGNITEQFFGVYRILQRPAVDQPRPSPDMANPQSLLGALGSTASFPFNPVVLGIFPTDDTSDYAIDQGLASFYKRVFRRVFSKPGAFLHLGQNYGVGVQTYGKTIGRAETRAKLVGALEAQISQEPEVAKVEATTQLSTATPGLFRVILFIKLKNGQTKTYQFPVPVH